MVPELTLVSVPILVGDANDPAAFESWAVKTFPALKVPLFVKGTLIVSPGQNGEPETAFVVMAVSTVIVTASVAVAGNGQAALLVSTTEITSPSVQPDAVYVELFVPTFSPFFFH